MIVVLLDDKGVVGEGKGEGIRTTAAHESLDVLGVIA